MRPTWPRIAVLLGVLALAFVVARGCQDAQIRINQDQAVASAKEQIDFTATYIQVRLLRQGINRQPFWFVSLSVPIGDEDPPQFFSKLAVVKIEANTGKVVETKEQSPEESAKAKEAVARAKAEKRAAENQGP